jgi:hypothetical protein
VIRLAIGQPYIADRDSWPDGAIEYNYAGGGHELRMFWSAPTDAEVKAVRRGRMDLGLLVEPPVITLVWKIEGATDWSDCPYTIHRVEPGRRQLPPIDASPQDRALLTVLLVDSDTGILRAIRALTLPPLATAQLHAAIRAQAAAPFDPEVYETEVLNMRIKYAHPRGMARAASMLVRGGT